MPSIQKQRVQYGARKIPDVIEICYGRKPGWGIREIRLSEELEEISATSIRKGGKQ